MKPQFIHQLVPGTDTLSVATREAIETNPEVNPEADFNGYDLEPPIPIQLRRPLTVRSLEGHGKATLPPGTLGRVDRLFYVYFSEDSPGGTPMFRVCLDGVDEAGQPVVTAMSADTLTLMCEYRADLEPREEQPR